MLAKSPNYSVCKFGAILPNGYWDMAQNRKELNDDLEVKVFGQGHCCSEF